ncbi:hypothetical protein DFH11DRAFT_1560238 [Phellopilus nigrolimitatus]|nr:hypothetical protein DFH11DRAFT_1560238 [Phellopilus nigrolimitatus]
MNIRIRVVLRLQARQVFSLCWPFCTAVSCHKNHQLSYSSISTSSSCSPQVVGRPVDCYPDPVTLFLRFRQNKILRSLWETIRLLFSYN